MGGYLVMKKNCCKENINQLTSSRKVGIRDINTAFAPISRIKTLRDDEGRRGFTLIELLVVVLIIGILAAIALPQYQKAVEKARAAEAVTRISQLEKAIDLWKLTNPGEVCSCFWGECVPKCSPLDIEFSCTEIEGGICYTRDFSYQAMPDEIMAYSEGSHYYVLHVNLNTKQRRCGWFDSIGKAVCDGLAANGGWESIENYDV